MAVSRAALAALALTLAACGHRGPGGPHGPGGPSPMVSETADAVDCRVKPYAAADGTVTREALDKGLRAEFAAADTNGDGVLQKAEVAALNAARTGGCDSEPVIDWDGAGRMSYAAFAARIFTLFDRVDMDGDGILTSEELQNAGRPARGPSRPPANGAPGQGG